MTDAIKTAIEAARERDEEFLQNGVVTGTVAGRMEIRFAEALAVAVEAIHEMEEMRFGEGPEFYKNPTARIALARIELILTVEK